MMCNYNTKFVMFILLATAIMFDRQIINAYMTSNEWKN